MTETDFHNRAQKCALKSDLHRSSPLQGEARIDGRKLEEEPMWIRLRQIALVARDLDQIGRKAPRAFAVEDGFRGLILEAFDHGDMYQ